MEDSIAQFTAITSASAERAAQYLRLTDDHLEQALQLYFDNEGADLGAALPSEHVAQRHGSAHDPVTIDDDEDAEMTGNRPRTTDDDEAMARRLQEEMYGAAGSGGRSEDDVRAPEARQAQTLLGPGSSDWRDDPTEMNAAIAQQMMNRQQRRAMGRAGIFNQQQPSSSIWNADDDEDTRRRNLSRATGGASDQSSKSTRLAEMYRPPFEIMSKQNTWDGIRADGKEDEKWILVNVQDSNVFDCQVLNRDIWKNEQIQETIKEHFIFKQYSKDDPEAGQYLRFYFQNYESQDAYPHIAIVDPRTGEQVKVWSGTPAPKPMEFLQALHEFLDRYSLDASMRNPVAKRRNEKKQKDVHEMSEEEMMQLAMQNSIGKGAGGARDDDPDDLTRSGVLDSATASGVSNGNDAAEMPTERGEATAAPSAFDLISSSNPHEEPAATAAGTTRIQFRHPSGKRVVHRFALDESVRRIYEWLKADEAGFVGGKAFELIFMGKNMIGSLDSSVEMAGLKNGSVLVEIAED